MKEKLMGALGGAGLVLWYLLALAFVIIPIWATGFPFWVRILIFAVIMLTDWICSLVCIAVYAYGSFVVLSHPFSAFTVVFFVDLLLYLIFMFIPAVLKIISIFKKSHDSKR